MRTLQKPNVTFTVTYRLNSVERRGDKLVAHIGSDYGGVDQERLVDQVIVNHGTVPLDDIYYDLKPHSSNLGELSHDQLIGGVAQSVIRNPGGSFQLFRIGDAVSARNTHAAILRCLSPCQRPVSGSSRVRVPGSFPRRRRAQWRSPRSGRPPAGSCRLGPGRHAR